MLKTPGALRIVPSEYQLADLPLWPPAQTQKDHAHGVDRGKRCRSTVLRYSDRALCVRCGRVWLQTPPPPCLRMTAQQELVHLDRTIAALRDQQTATIGAVRSAIARRRDLVSTLKTLDPSGEY